MPCKLSVLHTVARTLLNSLTLDWSSTPPQGLKSSDYWAARFSFVLLAPVTANYTIAATVDDLVSMTVDDELQLPPGGSRRAVVWLERGYHDVVLHYLEVTGAANLRMTWDAGVANAVSANQIHARSCDVVLLMQLAHCICTSTGQLPRMHAVLSYVLHVKMVLGGW